MIGLCTDSSAQLPDALVSRYGVEVVPLTVVIDEHEYLDGVDLDADHLYDLIRCPDSTREHGNVRVGSPSPGQFAVAYDELVRRGCKEILSVHTSESASATMAAARLAAHGAAVPVRLIDAAAARFGVGCCMWAAADAVANGATIDEAAAVATRVAPAVGNVFIADAVDLAHNGHHPHDANGVCSVLTMSHGHVDVIERVGSIVDAVNAMARYALSWGGELKVAVGSAHRDVQPISDALAAAVGETSSVREVVQFRIGATLGIEIGPGGVGCVMYSS